MEKTIQHSIQQIIYFTWAVYIYFPIFQGLCDLYLLSCVSILLYPSPCPDITVMKSRVELICLLSTTLQEMMIPH